ncbi:hypothetical protein MIV004R [Invertebrate iridescent virus 3]|uniref:Uncharacterized protein 004R n=1 Tax=Invertebrate iridescent virus 3 TaxID=345201 RepID=VF067_IIV3|nr:hypothetical protein MIV004R [Invertebrate iridescent virus 3]Q197F6.1 RecName: Full=Uncharacterized protein 004R [Invertebrate iridescent virus 3]ABF82034.1 hypothetical protein MIV004R [Invertebrate iridescent virus 3]
MPPKNNQITYNIFKVDHRFALPRVRPKFPKFSELYLELLVNRSKVDPQLMNEPYVHRYDPVVSSGESMVNPVPPADDGRMVATTLKAVPRLSSVPNPSPAKPTQKPTISRESFVWESSASIDPSPRVQKKSRGRPASSTPSIEPESISRYRQVKRSIISSYYKQVGEGAPSTTRRAADSENERRPSEVREAPESRRRRETSETGSDKSKAPPPIKEIKKTFGNEENPLINVFEDYPQAKDEDDHKRELLFKFKRLRQTYPKVDIPDFTMLSNHETMKRTYDSTLRNLSIDSTVENYKSYLMMGFMACEMVLGKIGFDMEGYTQQQTLHMNKYEKLLVELGEKSYVPNSVNKWPVEVRLIGLMLFQTTIFIISKIIAKKTNVNLLQIYNNFSGLNEPPKVTRNGSSSGFASGTSSPLVFIPRTKRPSLVPSEKKMRGPSVTRDLAAEQERDA